MNILIDDFFKFNVTINNSNVSALIKCLQSEKDIELYKKWIAKEYNTNIEDEKVITRLNLVLELKDKIDTVSSIEDKKTNIRNFIEIIIS